MMTILGVMFILSNQNVERTIFEIQFIEGRQIAQAKLALHIKDTENFSLHLSKSPAGTLLLYWATPEHDVLSFPKQSQNFVGKSGVPFALFANGPRLTRGEWLTLLQTGKPDQLGDWEIYQSGDWFSLTDADRSFRIRWRETSRTFRRNVNPRVLEPPLEDFPGALPIEALIGFQWTEN